MNDLFNKTKLDASSTVASFMSKVYGWMTLGLALTSIISYYISQSAELNTLFIKNSNYFIGILILELVVVFGLTFLMNRLNSFMLALGFLFYSALNGITFSIIFNVYTQQSITNAFLTTTLGFVGLTSFGYITKKDLGPIGTFCSMALWGLIGFGLLSLFFPSLRSGSFNFAYNIIGLLIFAGLTAYDSQRIKEFATNGNEGTDEDNKEAIFGALTLYLDFVNLFLKILSLTGKRK